MVSERTSFPTSHLRPVEIPGSVSYVVLSPSPAASYQQVAPGFGEPQKHPSALPIGGGRAVTEAAHLRTNGPPRRLGDNVPRVFPVLLFDGDCAFCTSTVNALRRYVRPRANLQPWQRADLASLGVSEEQCQASIQWIPAAGARAVTEGRAVAAVLKVGRQPWPLVAAVLGLPGVAAAADVAYRLIAANRHRLPGSTPACRLPEAPVGEASSAA